MENKLNQMAVEFLYYNRWANLHLIDTCINLTPDQLACSAPGTYGSIYNTLVHITKVEASYFKRMTGVQLDPPFSWESAPSLSEIRPYAERVSSELVEASERMQITDSIQRYWNDPEWEGQPNRYKAVGFLIQILNHGVEHRTNITTIMYQQGIQTPGLDGWEYMRLNPDRMGA
jgi:uncharacterized damage-inducible protein DinB